MKIPPHLAHTLAAAVDEGSLDAAAHALHITPPAVSQRIRQLEHLTGQVLLVRSRPVRATDAGRAVIRYSRQIAQLEAQATRELGLAGSRASVPIAVNADSLATWLLGPLAALAEEHAVTFDLHRDDQERTVELLEQGVVLAAVTSRAEPVPGCSVRRLGAITYRAAASAAFARRWFQDGVTAAALASAPLVDFDRSDDLQSSWLAAVGVDPALPPRHRIPGTWDMTEAIRLGLGWGLVISTAGHDHLGSLVDLGEPAVTVPLYWQQWRAPSTLMDAVAAALAGAAAQALDD